MKRWMMVAVLAILLTGMSGRAAPTAQALSFPLRLDSISMVGPSTGWAVRGHTVFRTTDGGHIWFLTMPARPGRIVEMNTWFLDAHHAWIAVSNAGDEEAAQITVFRTTDAGRQWKASHLPVPGGVEPGRRLMFSDATHGWLLVNRGMGAGQAFYVLMRTTDGGAHWRRVATEDPVNRSPGSFPGCDCTDAITFRGGSLGWSTGTFFALPIPAWLWVTRNGGSRWTRQSLPLPRGAVAPELGAPQFFGQRDGVVPAAINLKQQSNRFEVFVTRDGGAHWHATRVIAGGQGSVPPVNFVDATHGWVAVGRHIWRTTDGGMNWQPVGQLRFIPLEIQFTNRTSGFALRDRSFPSREPDLVRTADGGRTWHTVVTLTD